jgi:hypothetical protein
MRLDPRHFVFGRVNNEWEKLFAVNLLKVGLHVITDLTDGLEGTVSDFGMHIGKRKLGTINKRLDCKRVVNFLTKLRDDHQQRVVEFPVIFCSLPPNGQKLNNEVIEFGLFVCLGDSVEVIHDLFGEAIVFGEVILFCVSFWRSGPLLIADKIDHVQHFEELLDEIGETVGVFADKSRLPFRHEDKDFVQV